MVANPESHPLFQPIKVGDMNLNHRVVMAPMARFRADENHIPTDMMAEYYSQRASEPGTFVITEATIIAPKAAGIAHCPGVWSPEQIAGWKKVTEAVHAKKSYIYLQIWALGRTADLGELKKEAVKAGLPEDAFPYVSASDVPLPNSEVKPHPLTIPEIKEYVELFAQAAKNAVYGAGFDGVEIHGANGYLIDQFIQNVTNKRTDEYGDPNSPGPRCKFALEVIDAVCAAVGPTKTAIRLSPWFTYYGMREADPVPTFTHLVTLLKQRQPNLAYIHLTGHTEELPDGFTVTDIEEKELKERDKTVRVPSTEPIRAAWKAGPNPGIFLNCEGHSPQRAYIFAKEKGDLVVFARWYLANPDLPRRIRENLPLNAYDQSTFYAYMSPKGYIDYPFVDDKKTAEETPSESVPVEENGTATEKSPTKEKKSLLQKIKNVVS